MVPASITESLGRVLSLFPVRALAACSGVALVALPGAPIPSGAYLARRVSPPRHRASEIANVVVFVKDGPRAAAASPFGNSTVDPRVIATSRGVADAFDAMTSARAYRPARTAAEAVRELWRCAGTQFDAEAVRALASALPAIEVAPPEGLHSLTIATPQLKGLAGLAGLTAVSGGRV